HVHPTFSHHSTSFSITANTASKDPDNKDLPNVIQKPGKYFLFGETMPMGEVMTMVGFDLLARGTPEPPQPLVLDPIDKNGVIVKKHEDYHLEFKPFPYVHCGSLSVLFNIQIYN